MSKKGELRTVYHDVTLTERYMVTTKAILFDQGYPGERGFVLRQRVEERGKDRPPVLSLSRTICDEGQAEAWAIREAIQEHDELVAQWSPVPELTPAGVAACGG